MPVVVRAIRRRIDRQDRARFGVIHAIEKNEFNARAVRENRLKLTPPSTTTAPSGELRPLLHLS